MKRRIAESMLVVAAGLVAVGCAAQRATETATAPARSDIPMLSAWVEPSDAVAPTTQPDQTPVAVRPDPDQNPVAQRPASGALPKGHPDISAMGGQSAPDGQPALPKGHPDIAGMGGKPAPQPDGMPALPKGHPDISKIQQGAATQPAVGSLVLRAVQGSAGGPAIGADPVVVQVFANNQSLGKLEAKLEADGTIQVDNIPTGAGYQVAARVTHAGVEYDATCEAKGSTVELSVPVYETTEQRPDWSVQMRHAIVHAAQDGLHVMEVVAIQNPGDRAWVGDATGAADGKRTTFNFPLPAGAANVAVGGAFHDCCTKVADGKIVNTMAIVPGVTQYQFNYTVPTNAGKADLTLASPAAVKTMMVLVPEGARATADGLDGPKTVNMGDGNTQFFKGSDVPANKTVKLSIDVSGVTVAKGEATPTGDGGGSMPANFDTASAAKAIAGVGGLLVVLLGGSFLVMKSPRRVRASQA
jgi:hypothetical protein